MEFISNFMEFLPETISLLFWLLFLSSSGLIFYWIKNRNKYLNFSHDIPESVIRDYQESLGQNIHAGASLTSGSGSNASVLKSSHLKNSTSNISDSEALEKLTAEIMELKGSLNHRDKVIDQLEEKVVGDNATTPSGSDIDNEQLQKLRSENEDLARKLKEFELIEDELVNLKDLQIENRKLKEKMSNEDIEEGEEGVGTEFDGEEVTTISDFEAEDDIVTIKADDEEVDDFSQTVSSKNDEAQKQHVTLAEKKKSFGKVKVKGGDLFGRWDKNKQKDQGSSQEEVDELDMTALDSPSRGEVEEVTSLGAGPSNEDDNENISKVESLMDEEIEKEQESTVVSGGSENQETDNIKVFEGSSEETEVAQTLSTQSIDDSEESDEQEDVSNVIDLEASNEAEEENQSKESAESTATNDKSAEELLDEFEKMLG